jgi:hypothetical protein
MIAVLVCDEDGVNAARILAAELHAAHEFAAGKTGVNQQAGGGTGDKRRITVASARQHRDGNRHSRENNWNAGAAVVTN